MLDLETLGTRPGSIIKTIGAVRFDVLERKITDEFYACIDTADAEREGLKFDAATVVWWLKQGDDARAALTKRGLPLKTVLNHFFLWIEKNGRVDEMWGNGANFDNALLSEAYRIASGGVVPWPFWADRCYRTMKALNPQVKYERAANSTAHNALDDARDQAIHLMQIINPA